MNRVNSAPESVSTLLKDGGIRKILAKPRPIPGPVREEIASFLAHELLTGRRYDIRDVQKFSGRLGVFYPILLTLQSTEAWRRLTQLQTGVRNLPALALRTVLPAVLDLAEEFSSFQPALRTALGKGMEAILEEFLKLLRETMALWGRRAQERSEVSSERDLPQLLRQLAEAYRQRGSEPLGSRKLAHVLPQTARALKRLRRFVSEEEAPTVGGAGEGATPSERASTVARIATATDTIEATVGRMFAPKLPAGWARPTAENDETAEGTLAPNAEEDASTSPRELEEIGGLFAELASDVLDVTGASEGAADGVEQGSSVELGRRVGQFMDREGSQQLLDALVGTNLGPKIQELAESLEGAADLLEVLSSLFPGRDWDYQLGELHQTFLGDLSRYAKLLERHREIRRMLDLMGRIELEYGSRRIAVSPFGTSEVHSVTKSKDIQRVLPAELAKLEDDTLKVLFFANWLEGNLLTYQLQGRNWVGGQPHKRRKGPVVALVDTSGSMKGPPEVVAKALMFAITRRMLRERRDVLVMLFSSVGQTTEFELTGLKKMGREFLEFLSSSFGGGTDFNTALKGGLDAIEKKRFRGADLLFITDGVSKITDQALLAKWKTFRKTNDSRVFTIIVGNDSAGGLGEISDEAYLLTEGENWRVDSSPAALVKLLTSTK